LELSNNTLTDFINLKHEYGELQHRYTSFENELELKLSSSNDTIEQLQSELSSSRRRLLELENFAKTASSIHESYRVTEINNIQLELKVKGD